MNFILDKISKTKFQKKFSFHIKMQWNIVFLIFTNLICIDNSTRKWKIFDDIIDNEYSNLIYFIIVLFILSICIVTFDMFFVIFRYICVFLYQSNFEMKKYLFSAIWNQIFTNLYILKFCVTELFIFVRKQNSDSDCIEQAIFIAIVTNFIVVFQIKLNNVIRSMMFHWIFDSIDSFAFENNIDHNYDFDQNFSNRKQSFSQLIRFVFDEIDLLLNQKQTFVIYQHHFLFVRNSIIWIFKNDQNINENQIKSIQTIDDFLMIINVYSKFTINDKINVTNMIFDESMKNN